MYIFYPPFASAAQPFPLVVVKWWGVSRMSARFCTHCGMNGARKKIYSLQMNTSTMTLRFLNQRQWVHIAYMAQCHTKWTGIKHDLLKNQNFFLSKREQRQWQRWWQWWNEFLSLPGYIRIPPDFQDKLVRVFAQAWKFEKNNGFRWAFAEFEKSESVR